MHWRGMFPVGRRGAGTLGRADRARPILAGKLAACKRLTAEARREQASAGPTQLTPNAEPFAVSRR